MSLILCKTKVVLAGLHAISILKVTGVCLGFMQEAENCRKLQEHFSLSCSKVFSGIIISIITQANKLMKSLVKKQKTNKQVSTIIYDPVTTK